MRKFIIFTLILSLVLVGCTAPDSSKNTTNTPDLYQSTPYEDWSSQTDPNESLESAASGPMTSDPTPTTPTVLDPSENSTDETNAPQQATEIPAHLQFRLRKQIRPHLQKLLLHSHQKHNLRRLRLKRLSRPQLSQKLLSRRSIRTPMSSSDRSPSMQHST